MMRYFDAARTRIDALSLRERVIIFAAVALMLIFAVNAALLDPLLSRQKNTSAKLIQQQQETAALQAAIQSLLQARSDDVHSPERTRIAELKSQLQQSEAFLQSRRDSLVAPGKMAGLLEQVLHGNTQLQLVELKTLPLSLLIEPKADGKSTQQIYKHGVQITVRGGYLDLMRYLIALENMPNKLFWGEVSLSVEAYPDGLLTLTVYTLSLDKIWLTV